MRHALFALPLLLSACVSERVVTADDAGTRSASLQVMNDPVTIVLAGRGAYRGRSVRIYPDTTTWVEPGTGAFYGVPTREVERVERVSGRKGAIRGAATAAALTGAAAALLVYNLAQSSVCSGAGCGAGSGILLGLYAGVGAASLGVGPGLLIGGAIGETEVIHFEAVPPRPEAPALGEAVLGGTLGPVPPGPRSPGAQRE